MANQLAAQEKNVILVARTENKLQQMKAELIEKYGKSVQYYAIDLSDVNAARDFYKFVRHENYLATHVINNAGVGNYGNFTEYSWKRSSV